MDELTKYFLNLLEVAETELKLARLNLGKVFKGISWFGMGVFLLGIGAIVLGWTLFQALTMLLGPVLAGLLTAVFILLMGGVFLWQGKNNMK